MNDNENKTQNEAGSPSAKTKKNNGNKIATAVLATILAVVFFFAGWFTRYYTLDPRLRKLSWLIDTLNKKYYQDVDLDELYGNLYDTVVPDQFSAFYTSEEYAVLVQESQGSSSNIGVALSLEEDVMRFALILGNSSADRAGIKTGMYLYRFGDSEADLQAGDYDDLSAFLRGKKDKDIVFECGFDEAHKALYTVRSTEYLTSYCTYADREGSWAFRGEKELSIEKVGEGMPSIPRNTAYIRLTEFNGNAAWEFVECLNKMIENEKTNLVLDLRSNGGGALSILQDIASFFTKNTKEKNPVVVKAVYNGGRTSTFRAKGNYYYDAFYESSKITVLADEHSASASECLIGAMLDYGAVNWGDIYLRVRDDDGLAHSYGKGVMQTTYVTMQGDAFRLTTAKIYWPVSGKNIHGTDNGIHERDGANRVEAPMYPGETDVFLEKVFTVLRQGEVM